jgi:uncharacterized protein YqjF (DUF2071 family)
MSGADPEEVVRRPMARQTWRSMSFLHWTVSPSVVGGLLPDGLLVDEFDGQAWVGLTAFEVDDFRVGPVPPLPRISRYPETNVRTYVRTRSGAEGIWLFTLEVDSLFTVTCARPLLGVPYRWAHMTIAPIGMAAVRYQSRRRAPAPRPRPGYRISVTHESRPLDRPDDLDHFLTGRWRAISRPLGRTVAVPTQHERWTLHAATVEEIDETLFESLGLGILSRRAPDRVRWSPAVHAALGPPRRA